jgi:hypothetical protein
MHLLKSGDALMTMVAMRHGESNRYETLLRVER